jgi:predicted AAA+ superfamily ATPase
MITKLQLTEIIRDQQESFFRKKWVEREINFPAHTNRIMIISGVRRCGKSTLIRQKLLPSKSAIYINFEDTRLINFTIDDFIKIEEIRDETGSAGLFLDEVQNIDKWELFARMINEKGIPLYITGSNASMLSRELGTRLTGRYNQLELFPFSFEEFISYIGLSRNLESFDKYFAMGGFPEHITEPDSNYHRNLLRDILIRDIAVRRNIINENYLIRLAVHLMSNIGKEFSYNNIAKILEFKSVRTVIDYCDYIHESYLMDFIPMYSTSIKKQMANPKKPYCVDPAFARSNSLSFSKDYGRMLENFVFNKLRRQFNEIYYFKNSKSECDFVIKDTDRVTCVVQSCWEINSDNIARELAGIKNAMNETMSPEGIIITYNQEDKLDGINLVPAWKWV